MYHQSMKKQTCVCACLCVFLKVKSMKSHGHIVTFFFTVLVKEAKSTAVLKGQSDDRYFSFFFIFVFNFHKKEDLPRQDPAVSSQR